MNMVWVPLPPSNNEMRSRPEYNCWVGMFKRCLYSKSKSYRHYGAKGITVTEKWRDFDTFCRDVGPRPSLEHTLDRIDNTKGYAPGNVRWATFREQAQNRSDTKFFTYKGEKLCVSEWARRYGVPVSRLGRRLARGVPIEAALFVDRRVDEKTLTFHGRTQTLEDWAKELGIKTRTLWGRVHMEWSDDEIIGTPVQKRKKRSRK